MNRQVEGFKNLNPNIRTKYGTMDIDNNPGGSGVVPSAVVSKIKATESGDGIFRQTKLELTAVPVTMRNTEQGGGAQIYQFPKGRITTLGAIGSIAVTTTSALASTLNAESTCNWGVGSVTQTSATVATTEQNLVNVTAFTSSETVNVAGPVSKGSGIGIVTSLDGTSAPIAAFLNLAVASGDDIDGDASVTVTGTIILSYVVLGDQ